MIGLHPNDWIEVQWFVNLVGWFLSRRESFGKRSDEDTLIS